MIDNSAEFPKLDIPADQAVRESPWLRQIFLEVPALVAVLRGPDHVFELVNPLFSELTGEKPVLGRPIREVFPELESQGIFELLDRVFRTGDAITVMEHRMVLERPDEAQELYLNFTFRPLRSEAGAVVAILAHGVDITAQVRARQLLEEQAAELEMQSQELQAQAIALEELTEEQRVTTDRLSRSEALLAEAQRMAHIGSWEWDIANNEVFWTSELYRLFGFQPGKIDVSFERYLSAIHPDDRELVRETVQKALQRRKPFEFAHRVVTRDGDVRDFLCRGRVWLDADGQPVRMSGSAQDVTDQLVAERARQEKARIIERLYHFGQSVSAGLDIDHVVQEVTDAATMLTSAQFGAFFYNMVDASGEGYTLYKISGVPREAFSQFPMPRNTAIFAPTFRGERVVRSDDITKDPRYGKSSPHYGMPAGHLPVRSYLAVPVISRSGAVIGGLFFGHPEPGRFLDKHERLAVGIAGWAAVAMDNAQLFEAERNARADAENANNAKSNFLAIMSHELRTPLNAMIGYSDLLLAGIPEPITDGVRQKVERIGLSARHLRQLIDEILSFSRLEAGEEHIHAASIDAESLVQETEALLEPLATAKKLRFTTRMPPEPLNLQTDSRKIVQILLNLVGNAVKFTEQGSVDLIVESAGTEVLFHIADTGPGIPAEHLDQIFEPFWQVHGGATRPKEGTGLGLSVSRRLARLLGGELTVQSTPGVGTKFTLKIPAAV